MTVAQSFINLMGSLGVFDFVLPFFLVYAIVYGILYKTKFFGDPKDMGNLYATIAFAVALIFVGFNWATGFLKNFIPYLSLIILIFFSFLLGVALFVGDLSGQNSPLNDKYIRIIMGIVLLVLIILILIVMPGGLLSYLGEGEEGVDIWGVLENIVITIVVLAFLGVFIYLVTRGGSSGSS